MKYLKGDGEGYATLQCDCGQIFEVDVHIEENLEYNRAQGVLIAKCPTCGRLDDERHHTSETSDGGKDKPSSDDAPVGHKPQDLDEALKFLSKTAPTEGLEKFKGLSEEKAVASLHFTLGRWMRNTWGLWSGNSHLYKFFKALGIEHADDMTGIILTSWHRTLNNREIDLDSQVKYYKDYWTKG